MQVIRQYNEGLLTKQERCKHFIIRQLEVSGRQTTEEEVNEMMAAGKWEVFNENLLNDSRITRAQLSEIEQRHKVECCCLVGHRDGIFFYFSFFFLPLFSTCIINTDRVHLGCHGILFLSAYIHFQSQVETSLID